MSLLLSPSKNEKLAVADSTGTDIPAFMHSRFAKCALILSDLDGCLISGQTILPGAQKLTQQTADRLWIVSNNSTDTSQSLAQKLGCLGLNIAPERILLAGEATIRLIAKRNPKARIALYASPVLRELATELGLKVCRGEQQELPELAILTRDPAFTMTDLERLMRLTEAQVPVMLANPDPVHPAADGTPVPETGALFAALQAGFSDIDYETIGKPSPYLLQQGLSRARVLPQEAVFIGDTPATDGEAAKAAGVPFVLIRRPARLTFDFQRRHL